MLIQTTDNPTIFKSIAEKRTIDFLTEQYTQVVPQVLDQDSWTRQVIMMDNGGVARAYAIITKNGEGMENEEILEANAAIEQGESIETAFRKKGFTVKKNILDIYTVSLSTWLQKSFCTTESFAKAVNFEFVIRKGDEIFNYALIKETYSPELISAQVSELDTDQVNFSFTTLKAAGFSKEKIWELL